jgi:glycosyltransferase involved in cell wall biosynthesis
MKILYVTNSLSGTSGTSRYSAGLVEAMVGQGHEVQCIVEKAAPGYAVTQIELLTWSSDYLVNPLRAWRAAQGITRTTRSWQPDLIHILVEPYATAVPFLRPTLAPVVLTVHGTYAYIPHLLRNPAKQLLSRILTRMLYTNVRQVVSVSDFTKQYLIKKVPSRMKKMLEEKIVVIGNGIQANMIQPHAERPASSPPRILFVGGVKERKGVLEALAALVAYREKRGSSFTFHIVGSLSDEPWYVEKVRAYIESQGLGEHVTLLGQISEEKLQKEYAEADVFLMLSLGGGKEFEGYGLVYLEANACSVPVIGARGTGVAEAIQEGVSGLLVSAEEPGEVAEALHTILSHRAEFAQGAYEWAQQHEWSRLVTQYESVYTAVLGIHYRV